MPCAMWSRARKFDNLGPPPLRDDHDHLWGLPSLFKRDHAKVQEGNHLLQVAILLIHFCISKNIAWVLENPWTSRAWLTRPLQDLQAQAALLKVDYCQYGMPWRKATGLLFVKRFVS